MEALAALSLACNILQLIDVSLKATKALRTIRDEHAPDAGVQSNAATLRHLGREVMQAVAGQLAAETPQDDDLLRRARDVAEVALDLENLLHRFTIGKKNKLRDALAYIRLQGEIKAKEKRLHETQAAFQSTILVDIRQTITTQWSTVSRELPSLKSELQTFILEVRQGNTTASLLARKVEATMRQGLSAIQNDTRKQLATSENIHRTLLNNDTRQDQRWQDAEHKAARDKFVSSLYFSTMNARRNMSSITAADGTFEWILDAFPCDESDTASDKDDKSRNGSNSTDDDWEEPGGSDAADDTGSLYEIGDDRVVMASVLRRWTVDEQQQMFWVSGKAGSGKSTFMNYLMNSL
ncbi:hypothetical protein Micbo1qcDRAFT_206617 [Microdochium bolleyi]|uniref:Uncharacterized protein n=1 Tax=Microdochium bolleyi TaxID=196109 RepID=A0A136IVS9_9PEZI|nr:hypothetical protein Micbo1qcDRAFT_206617 [Microdochium bolleyi]